MVGSGSVGQGFEGFEGAEKGLDLPMYCFEVTKWVVVSSRSWPHPHTNGRMWPLLCSTRRSP